MFMLTNCEKYSTLIINKMEKEFNIAEVKKVLEDAGSYDPTLSQQLMIDFYKAIKDSKNTATVEDETRRISEYQEEIHKNVDENVEHFSAEISTPSQSKEKPFTPKAWTSEKKLLNDDIPEHNNNQNIIEDNILGGSINDMPRDATKVTFGFNEMVKDSEQTLSIISHELKYVPIQNSQIFLGSETAVRAKMLYAYHTKVNKMKNQLARMSFYAAPLPKVISVTDTFPSFSDDIDFQETYVCRSGRQTKRKVYNYDDDDSQDSVSNKKSKNSEEQEWLCKSPQYKSTLRKKSESNHVVMDTEKTEAETDSSNDNSKQLQKSDSRTPLSKKPTNMEIMKRSSLFGDKPKRRCEAMFDKLKDDAKKKERDEKATSVFFKTLEQVNEENNEIVSKEEVITVDDDEPIKRRVIPSIPGRKPINNRKRNKLDGLTPLNITVNNPTPKKDTITKHDSSSNSSQEIEQFVTKSNTKKRSGLRNLALDTGIESAPSTSQVSKVANDVLCPICNILFSEKTIEEHAATCGDELDTRSTSKISRITCEICDKVVDIESNYEVHVKECRAKKKDKNL